MNALGKKCKVKGILYHMCRYGDGCPDCKFFDPEDDADGDYFCAIRDSENRILCENEWDMASAMIGD